MNHLFKRLGLVLILPLMVSFNAFAESLLKPISYYKTDLLPYVSESAETFSTWDHDLVTSIMHPKVASNQNQQWVIDSFHLYSKLGVLKVLGKPKLVSLKSGNNKLLGEYVEITYQLIGFYQNGEALIDIKIFDNNIELSVLHFGVHFTSKFMEEHGG